MKKYIYSISYDLRQPGRNYANLYEAIKKIDPNYQHPLESNWFVRSFDEANNIYEILRPHIDDNDLLFVVEVNAKNRQGWMLRTFWNWFKEE